MKRVRFLGAAAAATLAGCSGHAAGLLPSAKPASARVTGVYADPAGEMRLSGASLTRPIIGEVGTFAGTTPPSGWAFARGQVVPISQNAPLFSILGTSAGGDGKTTFGYPAMPGNDFIIAIAGTFPSSPEVLANNGRMTFGTSTAGHFQPAPVKPAAQPSAELVAERNLAASAPRYGTARPEALDLGLRDRIRDAQAASRTSAFAALSNDNASRVRSLVAEAVAGRQDVGAMARGLAAVLTPAEASSLLAISDASDVAFRGSSAAHRNLQAEAAQYLVSIAFTPDEVDAMMERSEP